MDDAHSVVDVSVATPPSVPVLAVDVDVPSENDSRTSKLLDDGKADVACLPATHTGTASPAIVDALNATFHTRSSSMEAPVAADAV